MVTVDRDGLVIIHHLDGLVPSRQRVGGHALVAVGMDSHFGGSIPAWELKPGNWQCGRGRLGDLVTVRLGL